MKQLRAADGRLIVEVSPAPEFFFERVSHIEMVGTECLRRYCCILRDGIWQVQYTAVSPLSDAMVNITGVEAALQKLLTPNVVKLERH